MRDERDTTVVELCLILKIGMVKIWLMKEQKLWRSEKGNVFADDKTMELYQLGKNVEGTGNCKKIENELMEIWGSEKAESSPQT